MSYLHKCAALVLVGALGAWGCGGGTIEDQDMRRDTGGGDVRQDTRPDTRTDPGDDVKPDVEPDVAPDVKPDVEPDVKPDMIGDVPDADMPDLIQTDIPEDGAECPGGCNGQLCNNGTCVPCNDRADDVNCTEQYGKGFICQGGTCIQGNCHDLSDCVANGQVCGKDFNCRDCVDNTDDNLCGNNNICRGGECIPGCDAENACPDNQVCDLTAEVCRDCVSATDCPNGGICDVGNSFTCAACTSNADCTADPPAGYGANHICVNGVCTDGNCLADSNCTNGQLCKNNFCTACTPVEDDARCGAGSACVDGVCTPGGCNSDSQCTPPNTCQQDNTCGCSSSATCGGGVCVNGSCTACTSDAQCVTEVGPGRLCIDGTCIVGNCRVDSDCAGNAPGGQGEICCGNSCTTNDCCGVGDDAHCASQPGFVCNEAGQCVCPERPAGTVDVNAETGDDTTGNGSAACPVRSISRGVAIANATAGTAPVTVRVADGLYSAAATGESYPIRIDRLNVVVAGASMAGTRLTDAVAGGPLVVLARNSTLQSLSLTNEGNGGVVSVSATATLSVVSASGTGSGDCVLVNAGALASVNNSTLQNCGNGVNITSGHATLRATTVTLNGTGVRFSPTGTAATSVLITQGSRINANLGNGVLVDTLNTSTATIDGAQIRSNGQNGVSVARNGRVRIRRSTILANSNNGVLAVGASARVDLGTDGDPGGNTLGSATEPNLGVGVCNQTANTINAVNNTWSDCPPTQSVDGCSGARDFNVLLDAGACVPPGP